MDHGEPVTLVPEQHERIRRWKAGSAAHVSQQVILGRLGDRWYVEHVSRVITPARAYPTRAQAEQVARQVMAANGTGWVEIPASGGY